METKYATTGARIGAPTVIPNHIRAMRKARGMSQKDIADILGVTAANISYYESLAQSPPDTIKVRLCQIFECSITELFDWEA